MRVRFTATARSQLLRALAYIKRDDPTAARRLRQRAEKILRRLEEHPESGRRIPEFPDLPHREVIVRPYRFCHRVDGDVAWIVAVRHGAQAVSRP